MSKHLGLFYLLFGLFFLGGFLTSSGQYKIASIDIQGNQKTKLYILKRELPYHVGDIVTKDSLPLLNVIAHDQLVNTSLFNAVVVNYSQRDSNLVDIHIQVTERWYFFPLPYFRWVDRNFSEWWVEQHRSLDRVNYGINFRQSNATGNNDKLVIGLITGYTQQMNLRYQFPFIDKKLKVGVGAGFQYYTQKEINYTTENDKQSFYKTEDVNRNGYRANVNLYYRPNLFERHIFQVGFGKEAISDSAFLKQAYFLPNFKKEFSYFDVSYTYAKFKLNYIPYPSSGHSTELSILQRISSQTSYTSFQLRKVMAHSFTPSNFIYFESNSIAKFLPNQNYMDQKLMGYGNMQMSGLEYYVIDGNAGTMLKAELHHSLGSITMPSIFTSKFLPVIKYKFWIKAFTNLGYVYSESPKNSSKLSNTLIRTVGLGLDIISIYDFVLKVDYSLNQLGDKGLYLHGGINF